MLRGALRFSVLLAGVVGSVGVLHAQDVAAQAYVKKYVRVTLREGTEKPLEEDQEDVTCSGKAALSLRCRPVTLTVANRGKQDIWVNIDADCGAPHPEFEWLQNGVWKPLPGPLVQPSCSGMGPEEFIPAGGELKVLMRISWGGGFGYEVAPFRAGSYRLRAKWNLLGCVGTKEACLERTNAYGVIEEVAMGWVVSNEVVMTQPE